MDDNGRSDDSESATVDPPLGQLVSMEDNQGSNSESTASNLHTSNVNRAVKRVHSEEEIFSCSYCHYKTSKKNCLPTHVRLVHWVKQYSCRYCDFKTSDRCELSEHVEYKHEPFACTKCEFKTGDETDLKRHVKNEHKGPYFYCPLCPCKAWKKKNLKRHIKLIHSHLWE